MVWALEQGQFAWRGGGCPIVGDILPFHKPVVVMLNQMLVVGAGWKGSVSIW